MNSVHIMGRLTNDPTIKVSANDCTVAWYVLAVQINKDNTEFIPVTSLGKTAEFAQKYLKKGMKILISGYCHNDSYKNSEGKISYNLQIIAQRIEFCESKKSDESNENGSNEAIPEGEFGNIPDNLKDSLPFA